jgi:hypothetical protein
VADCTVRTIGEWRPSTEVISLAVRDFSPWLLPLAESEVQSDEVTLLKRSS